MFSLLGQVFMELFSYVTRENNFKVIKLRQKVLTFFIIQLKSYIWYKYSTFYLTSTI